jgi:glycosyltransferase involved in cell wall biosynthesis
VITGLNVGGAEMALFRQLLCEPLNVENVSIVSLTELGVIGPKLQSHGYKVYALGLSGLLSLAPTLIRLVKLFKQIKPDVVQTWMYHADLLGGLAARVVKCRKIFWGIRCTQVPIGSRMTYAVMKACAKLSTWLPHKIVCVAEAARLSHIEYGYEANKMVVIPNGFDAEHFSSHRVQEAQTAVNFQQQNSDAKSLIIGCVGRFHQDKGQDILIDAAAQLVTILSQWSAEQGVEAPKVHFVLVGLDCDRQNDVLLAHLESQQLSHHFTLYGQTDDVPAVLAGFDVFCMPSRSEGFPNGLGEAMAMGLPCVATDAGDTKRLGDDVVRVVRRNDVDALAKGLANMILLSDQQRESLGNKSAQRIRQHYSIASTKAKFEHLHQNY